MQIWMRSACNCSCLRLPRVDWFPKLCNEFCPSKSRTSHLSRPAIAANPEKLVISDTIVDIHFNMEGDSTIHPTCASRANSAVVSAFWPHVCWTHRHNLWRALLSQFDVQWHGLLLCFWRLRKKAALNLTHARHQTCIHWGWRNWPKPPDCCVAEIKTQFLIFSCAQVLLGLCVSYVGAILKKHYCCTRQHWQFHFERIVESC